MTPELLNLAAGQSGAGAMTMHSMDELRKALTAGYGTDVAQLTGGGALRIQSLDKQMKSTIAENKHFKLMNRLAKSDATATVDEWTEQSAVGGFLGGSTNTEDGVISDATGQYDRRFATVKYLMTRRQVSLVTTLGNNIVNAEVAEQRSGIIQVLQDAEYLCFEGDSRVVPTEFDGIRAILEQRNLADNIFNADAGPVHSIDLITDAAAYISRRDNFGTPTDIFCSQNVQADFDTYLDPAFRVPLTDVPNGGIQIGAPVRGVRTSWGDLANQPDVFVREGEEKKPFHLIYPVVAAKNVAIAPAAVVAAAAGTDPSSTFTAARGGNYTYAVAGVGKDGASIAVASGTVAVTTGQRVNITITPSTSNAETGYIIYRSRQNGGVTLSDMREIGRIPRAAGGGSTVYSDLNLNVPGTSNVYVLSMNSGDDAISMRQLLPMMRFNLSVTNAAVIPWAQLWFGYLRLQKAKQHVVIKNVLPSKARWLPFT